MFGRISNTWSLMGQSWQILKQDKEMLIFPLISGICCILVTASFVIPMIANDSWMPPDVDTPDGQVREGTTKEQVLYYSKLFAFYCCTYLVMIFFNSAIIGCAAMRMNGQNPTVADGFRIAGARFPSIVGWALIAATVGLILRIIEDKNEKIGRFVAGLLGMAWSLISFLVLPVLVIENETPISALKKSTVMLKRTWGEQVIGGFSFGMIFFLLFLPALLIVGLGAISQSTTILIACIVIAVLYVIILSLIQSTLQVVFQTALYFYAKNGTAPLGFDNEVFQEAFHQR
ncbi:MAG: hypothetical protein JXA82_04825 [Sedimentisphaerales bacterium]|nr:hypothetical protein [Sedimentisphaerales bacterium]